MRLFRFLGSVCFLLSLSVVAEAQTPFRIMENGSLQTLQYKLNMIGSTVSCSNNNAQKRIDCTWSTPSTNVTAPIGGDGTGGNPLTCTTCLTGTATTTGDTFYSTAGGNGLSRLAAGATGTVLSSPGTSSAPSWTATLSGLTLSSITSPVNTAFYSRSQADTHGTTITPFFSDTNSTVATVGAQKVSRSLHLCGNGWKTTATAGSQPVCSGLYTLPIQSTTNPLASLQWYTNVNGGGNTARINFVYDSVNSNTRIYGDPIATASYIQLNPGDMRLFGGSGSSVEIRWESNNFFPTASSNMGTTSFPWFGMAGRQFHSVNTAKPTCAVSTGAGTGATCTVESHSSQDGGAITVATGTSPTINATVVTLTGLTEDDTLKCVISPGDLATAQKQGTDSGRVYSTNGTNTGLMFTIIDGGVTNPLDASSTYKWNYVCMGSTSVP